MYCIYDGYVLYFGSICIIIINREVIGEARVDNNLGLDAHWQRQSFGFLETASI